VGDPRAFRFGRQYYDLPSLAAVRLIGKKLNKDGQAFGVDAVVVGEENEGALGHAARF
jgi:hypothetical protein